jgi:hypothetical protein
MDAHPTFALVSSGLCYVVLSRLDKDTPSFPGDHSTHLEVSVR